jgi:aubergine-like protein
LFKYREKNNGELPSRIIVYRDGVGDGDITSLIDFEVNQMLKSFEEVKNEYK